MHTKTNSENIYQSACFIAAIATFCLLSIYACIFSREKISFQENRILASFPKVHSWKKDIPRFSSEFEPYFKDRLPFRLQLISARNFLAYELFQSSGNPLVAVGLNNWLFYKSYGVTPAQLNLEPFSREDLEAWGNDIIARKSFLEKHHIKYVLVVVPEKGSIYSELLPHGWKRQKGTTRLEQLQQYLRDHSNVDYVDARALLASEKAAGQKTYHSNDTHWNQRSAFLVSQQILEHLHKSFPNVSAINPQVLLQGHDLFSGDLSKMLGMQTMFPDDSPSIVVNQTPRAVVKSNATLAAMDSQEPAFAMEVDDDALPRALVLRDSFCTYLVAPLSEHFKYCEYQWTNTFAPEAILAQKPDVVINEIAERHLYEEFHEHVPTILVEQSQRHPLCTFDKKIELLQITAQKDYRGTNLELLWRNKGPVKLNFTVGLHCLDDNKKLVGGADYQPDVAQKEIIACSSWVDKVRIPDRELKDATQIGVLLYRSNKETLACDAAQSDWNARYVTTIRQLKAHENKSRRKFALSRANAY